MSFTAFQKGHTGSADEVQANFLHVGQGSLAPRGGNSLELTTSAYDIGSDVYRWNQAYINTVNMGSGTMYKCMNLIAEVTLTATASSIEFTGLNGETDVIYEINAEISGYATQTVFLFFNNDSATANYGRQVLYGEGIVAAAYRFTSNTGFYFGYIKYDTTTAIYQKNNLIIYANNLSKLGLFSEVQGIGNSYVRSIEKIGFVWNNSETLTSMKIIGYFNPNTHVEIWAKR